MPAPALGMTRFQRIGEPFPKFIFVVGHELDLIPSLMRIDLKKFLTVIVLAVDECDKQPAGHGTQHIGKNSRLEIFFQLVTSGVLAVFQRPRITTDPPESKLP